MGKLSEGELKKLIQDRETNTIEFKVATPGAAEMAERLCGMVNAQDGMVILGSKTQRIKLYMPDVGKTRDVISSSSLVAVFG